jgi:hypothetical protein
LPSTQKPLDAPLDGNRHQRPTSRAPGFPAILASFADFGRWLDGNFHV